jgi:CubicO group peptidase (beta-lactamase class C family)
MVVLRAWVLLAAALCPMMADDRSDAADQVLAPLKLAQGPGCAVGVIHESRLLYSSAFGLADLEQRTAITTATPFPVASLSKQFTAAAIFLLKQDGKLHLEDAARHYLPELPAYADGIRIVDLLHHTSGLRDIAPLLEAGAAGRAPQPLDVAGSLRLLAAQSALNFAPGTDYEYSNSDYLLLGLIVERVSGMSLAEFARERLFHPLGMRNSAFHSVSQQLADRAAGYFWRGGLFRRVPFPWLVAGDGGLYSTVDDLLRWDQNFAGGRLGGEEFAEFMETRGRLASGQRIQYASGLVIGRYRGLRTVSHEGRLPGTRSEMLRFPGQQLTVICLCNRGDADSADLARRIASIYLAGKLNPAPQPADLDYPSSGFPELDGIWESKQGWIVRTWSSVDHLSVETGEGLYRLSPRNRRQLFDDGGRSGLVLTKISKDQFVLSFDGGLGTPYHRLEPDPPRRADLPALAGDYRSADVAVRYHFSVEDGRLRLTTGEDWHIDLEPAGPDRFVLGPWSLHFLRDAKGAASGMELHRARVWNLRFAKE